MPSSYQPTGRDVGGGSSRLSKRGNIEVGILNARLAAQAFHECDSGGSRNCSYRGGSVFYLQYHLIMRLHLS